MSSIRHAILSLLAREQLSGYDIKQYMNNRIGPFWKVSSNQVYPELSKMENEGLVKLQVVEQNTYRPARKVYEITETGKESLIQWTLEPTELEPTRSDFLLKMYNSWLVHPQSLLSRVEEMKNLHEEVLTRYLEKVTVMSQQVNPSRKDDPLASSITVIQFGIEYERNYIQWLESLIEKLKEEISQR